ncbi:DUF1838 family protein [Novosphingobium sp.]|uniref:DUF1838 family protein n=1 Tax=Novosphingobium sp. TaxID=1874826 RepID=UPI00286DE137|nr:DUF1838 family protein [Novosphingobium sp.]
MDIDRRMVLGGLAAGAIAAQVSAAGAAGTSPASRMRTFMLMRGALDERLISSWMSANYYGVVDDRMEPLFDVVAAVFARYRRLPDGSFEGVSGELAWFVDKDTGKAMDTYRNPYTGETVDVPSGGLTPSKILFMPDLSMRLSRSVPGMEFAHEVIGPVSRGNDVWLTERSRSSFKVPGQARPMRYSESNIFKAKRSAIEAKGATRVTSDVAFTNVVSWRPWLKMGDHPGHLTATGAGQHTSSLDMFPPEWIAATRARRPEVLKDPASMLAPLWDAR